MIDLTKLLSKTDIEKDCIRYSKDCSKAKSGVRKGMGPVVVWNITNICNFKCKHCYSNAVSYKSEEELSTKEVKKVIDDLASINVPVILLSGGEPLMRDDIFEIIKYIKYKGISVSLSTNGSLITQDTARILKDLGIGYVGISLDGTSKTNDYFRGVNGAYDSIVNAIKNCKEVDQKVGLRFTIQKKNYKEVKDILKLVDEMDIPRICFYHLVPSGRGQSIIDDMLSHDEIKYVIDALYYYVKNMVNENKNIKEILTVANFTDGVYVYLKEKDANQKERILELLKRNGGNRSGSAIANIDYRGNVYPDQFFKSHILGNVKENSFSEIWNGENIFLSELRNKKEKVKGRCKSCEYLDICKGNLRARAYGYYGDIWAEDPSCYLTDKEIGVKNNDYIMEHD
ncbi:radical SAM/SPASM domain-containing protein [Tepidibacter formicigenes]|jgi:radical SAM protein with 4Fe4S-binding SPASM domain|uniref:Mycofactocin maturase MftC n=1 Tax=Tepidibacter formicigenes DSM 15518 TaxID=1123349 RepID=A0A1M6S799_9FIRM|nr:radical SAM protein [Tepidibacter formicigenes]SHK40642.1 radical SAM additional 4Fe4S-binding SPASM domain-containing protein [Tepidibacter formicigenes DSM 15518]